MGGAARLAMVFLVVTVGAQADEPEAVEVEEPPVIVVDPNATVEELLHVASDAFVSLDYEVSLAHATAALLKPGITDAQRVTAYQLQAGSHAVMGQQLDAQKEYRLLLRLRPDFQLPPETPPKILAAWNVVHAEEELIRRTVRQAERERIVNAISLDVAVPQHHPGGHPLDVSVTMKDPYAGVRQLVFAYRTDPSAGFATLPLEADGDRFTARVAPSLTASPGGLRMEYAVIARDADGEVLASAGTESGPRIITITPGQVPTTPLWRQPVIWAVAGTGSAVVAGFTGTVVVAAILFAAASGTFLFLLARGNGAPSTELGVQRFP